MLVTQTLRLVGLAAGAALYLLLAALAARRRRWRALAGLAPAALWYAAGAGGLFLQAATGLGVESWMAAWRVAGSAGAAAAGAGAAVSLARRFPVALAGALLLPPATALGWGADSAAFALAGLAPGGVLAWFVYRYNFLGLRISPRLVFAMRLGVVFAFYLLLVKRAADILEEEFDAFRQLVELALILAATLVWLPLYGWMNRYLSKRAQVYADFSKRLIEEAARKLDLAERIRFLEAELGRTFGLRRVLLLAGDLPPEFQKLLERKAEILHAEEAPELERAGFNYLFALRYEDRLTGCLALDCSPRRYLDEDEAVLLGLSRQISHSLETCRLVEDKIRLEKTLLQQEHLAGLGKVAATIAHEIKNPLSSIKTLVQLMGEDREVERQYGRDLTYVVGEIDRLNRSVQQLLSFSRPAPQPEGAVEVSALLEATAGVLAREYEAAEIRIERRIEPGLRLSRASRELLQQVVLNLALNAVQVSSPGGVVLLEAAAAGPRLRLAVSDQGPGVPLELREKIFEPFYTTRQKGTGLGLAIVRKNVRQLGGEIQVVSPIEGGRGARFEVSLPVE
jgi:signal transduction histidine kinase